MHSGCIKWVFVLLAVFVNGNIQALEWPLPDSVVSRNFGYNDRGKPVLGTSLKGEGAILAAGDGVIIFSVSENDTASRLPSPLGAWTAIDHDDGLISIYSRYLDGKQNEESLYAEQAMPVATAGVSGWSENCGLYFVLYDRIEHRWINTSMVINPLPDTMPPQILGIQLRNSGGKLLEGSQLRNLSQGRYTIIINAIDTMLSQKEEYLAPNKILCFVNGTEAGILSFDTICARDGVLLVNRNGLIPAATVYAPYPAWEAGEVFLNRGQAILEILVSDITGNSGSVQIRMLVE